ncbi:MAG: hypothetical protein Q9208_007113 [Pyrenodesmia sp. 3 TL-2023]
MGVVKSEFPLLKAAGLYVVPTEGNGNCLFHALSDQLYGDQSKHKEIREAVIQSMRDNGDEYKYFLVVHPGGGSRRNPKRKNAGTFSTKFNAEQQVSASDVNAVFEGHLARMAKGGSYGDNMELVAFAKAFRVDVTIYKSEWAYHIKAEGDSSGLPNLHIAYHTYEHYSSVRNIRGPHTGVPNTEPLYESIEAAAEAKEQLAQGTYILPWMVDVVLQSQTILQDRATIQKKLEDAKGDVNAVVDNLIESQQVWSSPGASDGSSSISREQDSDDEEYTGPNKKQDRRLSRASRQAVKEKEDQRKHELAERMKDRQLPSTKESASPPVISIHNVKADDSDETEEEDWRNASSYKDSESASVSTSASDFSIGSKPVSGGVRLKLSQPKKDANKLQPPATSAHKSTATPVKQTSTFTAPSAGAKIRRRLKTRNELEMLKAAKQANVKDHRKNNIARARAEGSIGPFTSSMKQNTPAVENRIKILCI